MKTSSFSTAKQIPLTVLNKRNKEVLEAERALNDTALQKAEKALKDVFQPESPHSAKKKNTKPKPLRGGARRAAKATANHSPAKK